MNEFILFLFGIMTLFVGGITLFSRARAALIIVEMLLAASLWPMFGFIFNTSSDIDT